MTAIGSFAIGNNPFVISDLLISIPVSPLESNIRRLSSPIRRLNISAPLESKYTITDVLQKTVKVGDRAIVAFAGDLSQARNAIRSFEDAFSSAMPSGPLFMQVLADIANNGLANKLSLLTLIEESGRMFVGGYNFKRFRSKKFLRTMVAGSGANDLIEVLASYRGMQSHRQLNNHEMGLALSLALTGNLIGFDYVTKEPTKRAYGGIYEISYWGGREFEKVTDVIHTHWHFKVEPGKGLLFNSPNRIQKIEYHDSNLYLRDLDVSGATVSDTIYIVGSPSRAYQPKSPPQKIQPNLSFKWCVSHLYFTLPNGKVRYKNRVEHFHAREPTFVVEESGTKIEMQFRHDYFDWLQEEYAGLVSEATAS